MIKKSKISKSEGDGATLLVLWAFRGDCVVGVWVVWRGEIYDL